MDGGMVPDSEFRCRSNIVSEFKALRAVGITPVSALPCRSRYLQCQQKHNNASKVDLTRPQPPQDVESGSVLQETTKQQQLCWYGAGQCIGAQIHVLQGRQCAKASCNGARELICLQLNLTATQTHAATRQGKPANEATHSKTCSPTFTATGAPQRSHRADTDGDGTSEPILVQREATDRCKRPAHRWS